MEKVNVMQALNVFEKIQQYGHTVGEDKYLDGVHANGGHDGYTVTLWDEYVTVTINFHNTCSINHIDKRYFETFLDKLAFIDRAYKSAAAGGD